MKLTESGARFSRCRRWRYLLWRCWDPKKPLANFLMLNPSTADELKLDPSCTRARNYVEQWGFGGLLITNIFGWRATDPGDMRAARDPVGRGNDQAILEAARAARLVVCAWGNHGEHRERAANVLHLLRTNAIELTYLQMNGSGHPAHPLYLSGKLKPLPWSA